MALQLNPRGLHCEWYHAVCRPARGAPGQKWHRWRTVWSNYSRIGRGFSLHLL